MADKFVPLTRDIAMSKFEFVITMNSKHIANLNPKIMQTLGETTTGPFTGVILGDVGTAGAEAAMRAARENEPDAVDLKRSKSQNTARVKFTRLVTKYPALRVPAGRLRVFKVTVRNIDGQSFLVINLKETEVEVAPKAAPKKAKAGDQPDSKTDKGNAKTDKPNGKTEPTEPDEAAAGSQDEQ